MNFLEQMVKMDVGEVKTNIDLADYTSYKMQGRAECLIMPKTMAQLKNALKFLRQNEIKHMVIGAGSNIVFIAKNYDGVLISLAHFQTIEINEKQIRVDSGYSLIKLAYLLARRGLVGLEFLAGIPGTVGGAVYMNAGAYGAEIRDYLLKVIVLTPELEIKELTKDELQFAYRSSWLQKNKNYICLTAFFQLEKGDEKEALALIEDRKRRRWQSQPLDYPSAGSVFRNPDNDYAGRIIEELGLKGLQVGDAKVSCKHANFIINTNKASGADIKRLIDMIKDKVVEKYQIDLVVEQEFIE